MDERVALGIIAGWANQTITFAIGVRDDDTHKRLDDPEVMKLATVEAHEQTGELWKAAVEECDPGANMPQLTIVYARKVFQWCQKHINP